MEAICADGTKKWAVQTVAGSTRHDPARAFTDGRPVSVGVTGCEGQRNAPTILNSLYNLALFWDGHAKALEDQASLWLKQADSNEFNAGLRAYYRDKASEARREAARIRG